MASGRSSSKGRAPARTRAKPKRAPRKAGGWIAVVDSLTGEAVSFADVSPPVVRPGYSVVSIAGPPNFRTHDWDRATQTLVARPVRAKRNTIVAALDDDAEFQAFSNPQKAAVRRIVTRLVGDKATVAIEAEE